MDRAPAILRGGFRPFFLGGAGWAALAVMLWLLAYQGMVRLPAADPLAWHRHEMLFGFVGAMIAGFLLTAIPNWTGRLPIAGVPLAALWLLWFSGRVAILLAGVGAPIGAIFDVAFFLLLAALAGREVIAARNRNLPVVLLLLLFGLAAGVDHAAAAGLIGDPLAGMRAGIALVLLMISVIGGRVIPSFTRNWMAKQGFRIGLPGQPTRFDTLAVVATGAAMLLWIARPQGAPTAIACLLAAFLQTVRLARWRGWRAVREPIVLVLHLGYAWLPVGLALLALAVLVPAVPRSAALHALTAGAMATMILAVATRATLGHTGRALDAGPGTLLIYLLVTLGAIVRVIAPFPQVPTLAALRLAAVLWGGAFLLFVLVYGPILARPRQGRP